jgi:hypothetical protein
LRQPALIFAGLVTPSPKALFAGYFTVTVAFIEG